jgi:hypothetical protein
MHGEGHPVATRRGVSLALCAAAVITVALCTPHRAVAQSSASDTKVVVAPYLWVPSVSGTLKYDALSGSGGKPSVDVGTDYTADLNFAFMISGEMRKGRWSAYVDFVYAAVSGEASQVRSVTFGGSRVNASLSGSAETSLDGEILTLAGGYQLFRHPTATIDGIVGVRYFGLQAETHWQLAANIAGPGGGQTFPASGSVSRDADLFDGVIGIRGRFIEPNTPWSFPYLFDIGTGSSALTWQAMAGISYGFSWGDIGLFYRHLSFDQRDDQLVQNLSFSGPAFGAILRF